MSLPALYNWFEREKRDLPWRNTSDPYKIWLSEIILQQTRVVQGLDYYLRFTSSFPTVQDLAAADQDTVLKLWQGLGYYSRARNLLKAAKLITSNFSSFPSTYNDILSLPGVGPYTAAAIASFAFNLPYAVLDGNVFRVLSRLHADATPIDTTKGKQHFTALANKHLDKRQPALHNQAIMELGALVCLPSEPLCDQCPLNPLCEASLRGNTSDFPVKQRHLAKRTRHFNYLHFLTPSHYLQQRPAGDIWTGLYELPLIETDHPINDFGELLPHIAEQFQLPSEALTLTASPVTLKHELSHQHIFATFYSVKSALPPRSPRLIPVSNDQLASYPISRLTELFLFPTRK